MLGKEFFDAVEGAGTDEETIYNEFTRLLNDK